MDRYQRRGRAVRLVMGAFLVGSICLHAQTTYTSTRGETSISADFDPGAPAPKAPIALNPNISYALPFQPTVPMEQYQAQKAEISIYSQPSFPSGSQLELSPGGPRAPSTPGPIVTAPTFSWQGLQDTGIDPPSPDIAVGPSDVVMVVNANIAQFTKSGTMKKSISFQDWFSDVLSATCPTNCLIFDPWVAYDQLHGRFLFIAGVTPTNPQQRTFSYLLLSVSKGPTFDGGWKNFALLTSKEGQVQTQFWGDSWRLGFDNQAVYLSGNMFDVSGNFQYSKVRVVKKSDLYNPATTTLPYQEIGSATGKLRNADGSLADSLVPLHQRGQPGAASVGLLVSATTFLQQPASFVTVWKIADPLAATLSMAQFNIGGLMPYRVPAPAQQLAQTATLDSGDTRILKAIYRNGFLYTARNTGYTDQATTITYDVIDTTASPMKIASQSRLLNTNSFYPAFDVPATTPVGTQFATAELFAGTTTAPDGSLTFAGISNNLKAGESPYYNFNACNPAPCRWGDYFGGAVDPVTGGLWVSGQYAKPPSPQLGGQWGTWVGFYPWLTTQTFNDVTSASPFYDYINVLNSWQITAGCGSNPPLFCPTSQVTRDQFATFIIRAMLGNNFTYSQTPHFTDVPASSPFFPYIQKLADLGLTHGCSATQYCPAGLVSRGDMSVLLVRGKLESLFGDNFTYPTTPFFTDVPASLPQFPYIQKMYELGLTSGCSATQYCPNANLTRQEVAVFLDRAFLN